MVIKFEDDKRDGAKVWRAPGKPAPVAQPDAPAKPETPLPFAKAVRPEKKRKPR